MRQREEYKDLKMIQNRTASTLVKKTHTRKTTVVNDEHKRILVLTPTTRGSMHDKKQFDKSRLGDVIPKNVTIWTDTGYQGLCNNFDLDHIQPKKRKKGTSLTAEEKTNNRTISGIRIVSEQAIGGMKRMNSRLYFEFIDYSNLSKKYINSEVKLIILQ